MDKNATHLGIMRDELRRRSKYFTHLAEGIGLMSAGYDTLTVEQDGRVLVVRVSDPPYNFMTARMQVDLDRLSKAVDADGTIGAVVFTGATPERYITHFDIAEILHAAESAGVALGPRAMQSLMHGVSVASKIGMEGLLDDTPLAGILNVTRFADVVARIIRSPAVWIAAISGPCGGGGLEMSVCFDIRYASSSPDTVFLLPELLIGLTTTVGAQRLVQLMGPARALEFMLEGRAYTSAEAAALGLVNTVLDPDELMAAAIDSAHRFARRPRAVVAAQKRVFNEIALLPLDKSLRQEGAVNAAGVVGGVAPFALGEWVRRQQYGDGDSVFLTDPQPWTDGSAADLNP